MNKPMSLLTTCFLAFLLTAAPVSAFGLGDIFKFLFKPFQKLSKDKASVQEVKTVNEEEIQAKFEEIKPILQQYDEEQNYDNILYNNEGILNKTCCWNEVKTSRNPLLLKLNERFELFKICYNVVRPFINQNRNRIPHVIKEVTKKDRYVEPIEDIEETVRFTEEFEGIKILPNYTYAVERYGRWDFYTLTYTYKGNVSVISNDDYESYINYYALACLQGYPVYQNKVLIQLGNASFDYPKHQTWYSINQIMPDIYAAEQLEEMFDRQTLAEHYHDGKIDAIVGLGNFRRIDDPTILGNINDNQNQINREPTVSDQEEPVLPVSKAEMPKIYDFPKINMNKQDIYDSFNYNRIIQTVLTEYTKIGIDAEGEGYTFHLENGKIIDITSGIDLDVQVKIFTTWEELKNFINLYRSGTTTEGIKALTRLNIQPWTVKVKALNKVKDFIS